MYNLNSIFNLNENVIVITGACGLLGRKHAEAIAAYGGHPILIDINQENINLLEEELSDKFKRKIYGFKVDITNENEIKSNSELLVKKFGKINALINNAANNPSPNNSNENTELNRLETFDLKNWNSDIQVGLTGSFLCSKHYGYKISMNVDGGNIINISSDLGIIAPDQRIYELEGISKDKQPVKPITYSVIKSGLIGLTKYLSTYWIDKNVRCNALCPGGIENGQPNQFISKVTERIPMKRMAKVNEYQGTLLWMLSSAASYLNGAVINVDGGRTAW